MVTVRSDAAIMMHRQAHFQSSMPVAAMKKPALTKLSAASQVRFASGLPPKTDYDVAIVGGGLSAMTAAYQLRKRGYNVAVIEAGKELGGNARSAVTEDGMPYTIGASVLAVGDDRQLEMLKEVGIDFANPKYKIHRDISYVDNKWLSVDLDKPNATRRERKFAEAVDKVVQTMFNILGGPSGTPSFPLRKAADDIFKWSRRNFSFHDFLVKTGCPPEVRKFFEVNFRSDVSEDPRKVDALAGIIDQGADQGVRILLPNGNHTIILRMKEAMDKMTGQGNVDFLTDSPVKKVEEGPQFATVRYVRDGEEKTVTAKNVLLALPSHRMPEVMDLPAKTAKFLKSIKRGSYAMLNLFLNEAPLQSNTYYKFPHATWVADIVQNNRDHNPDLPPGSKEKSILTCYIPIPRDLRKATPPEHLLTEKVIDEIMVAMPFLKGKIKGTRMTFYPESMSAPSPGQMKKLRDFDRQLTPHVRTIHSDLSGVFAARGAMDEALTAVEVLDEKRKTESSGSVVA